MLIFAFAHHYNGTGGYYATADEIRAVGEACIQAGLTEKCTLFLDGLLVERLQDDAPSMQQWFRSHPFPIGYHGDDIHGPPPLVEDLAEMMGRPESTRIVAVGQSADEAIVRIKDRYTQRLSGYQIRTDRYLNRRQHAWLESGKPGGILLVQSYVDRSVEVISGQSLLQPLVSIALEGISDYYMHQNPGPFASHFNQKCCDPRELKHQVDSFLGSDTQLFWFMGRIAMKGRKDWSLPPLSDLSAGQNSQRPQREKAGKAGKAGRGRASPSSSAEPGNRFEMAVRNLPRRRSAPIVYTFLLSGTTEQVHAGIRHLQDREDAVFVTPSDLWQLIEAPTITLSPTHTAAALLESWSDGPPDALSVQGVPASLTDAFQAMAAGLASGESSVTVSPVMGPLDAYDALSEARGVVSAEEIRAAAPAALAAIEQDRALPINVQVRDRSVGFHQYLYLMAEALSAPESTRISIPSADSAPPFASWLVRVMGRNIPDADFWTTSQYWTARPVQWR